MATKKNASRARNTQVRSTTWVAELLGLTPQTITEMARRGEIPAFRPRSRGWWKFDEAKVREYKRLRETEPDLPRPAA